MPCGALCTRSWVLCGRAAGVRAQRFHSSVAGPSAPGSFPARPPRSFCLSASPASHSFRPPGVFFCAPPGLAWKWIGAGVRRLRCEHSSAAWSSGMILASGARGPGLNSRSSPWSFQPDSSLAGADRQFSGPLLRRLPRRAHHTPGAKPTKARLRVPRAALAELQGSNLSSDRPAVNLAA